MSMVSKISECPETMDEARVIINNLEEQLRLVQAHDKALCIAIQHHCNHEMIPDSIVELCPFWANMLNKLN